MHSSHQRFFRRILRPLIGGLLFASSTLSAQPSELPRLPEIDLPTDTFTLAEPIRITDVNKNPQLLVGMDQGQLRLSFPNMPGAEAIVPVDGKDMMVTAELPADYNRLLNDFQLGQYGLFLSAMKETAEPLAAFLSIPAAQTNFHGIFSRYYEALALAGEVEDAVALSLRMPWQILPPEYLRLGERLVARSIEAQQFDQTRQLLALFYQSLPEADFSDMAFRLADALRTQGEHELAAQVYGSLSQSNDSVLQQKSLLWAGYSRAVAGDATGARQILDEVQALQRGDENFLTYCLALGRLGYADNNIREGLRYLSRAMVLTAVDATFKPELYYLLTLGYQQSGNIEASDRLAREFSIFYPENPWLQKYQEESGNTL